MQSLAVLSQPVLGLLGDHWIYCPLDEAVAWIDRLRDQWNRRLDRLEKALEEDDTR